MEGHQKIYFVPIFWSVQHCPNLILYGFNTHKNVFILFLYLFLYKKKEAMSLTNSTKKNNSKPKFIYKTNKKDARYSTSNTNQYSTTRNRKKTYRNRKMFQILSLNRYRSVGFSVYRNEKYSEFFADFPCRFPIFPFGMSNSYLMTREMFHNHKYNLQLFTGSHQKKKKQQYAFDDALLCCCFSCCC